MKHDPVIHDLVAFKVSYWMQSEPIPPILFQLVALMAAMAADEDDKTLVETGVDPMLEFQAKEGGHV